MRISAEAARDREPEDAAVVTAVLAGDVQRYRILVERYQKRLYRHALGMVLDRDTAAELVQDALVGAYERLRECRDPSRFGGWVFQALRNRCLDYLKDPRRRHVPVESLSQVLSIEDGAEARLRALALKKPLDRALEALPPLLREPFLLRHLEDMPYEEMAELLGASVSALKMRVMRAREVLRLELEGVVDR
jgi:RNA polymerase sigma-70 factor, ECF subfamily